MTNPTIHRALALSGLLGLFSAGTGIALAQGAADGGADTISNGQLASFAEANSEIRDITVTYQERAQAGKDVADLQPQMQQEMIAAVESAGLSVEDYNSIARAVQADPALQQKLQSLQ